MIKQVTTAIVAITLMIFSIAIANAWTPLAVVDDPLVRMPGTQPGKVSLEAVDTCLFCHEGWQPAAKPGFYWKGSMMTQSARDFLFWASLTVAGQDAIWAAGTPNAVDICERCHFPKGWLEGRSDPPNASAMTGADFDGVQCDFCHTLWDPFFETIYHGTREGSDWLGYWDETNASDTRSKPRAGATHAEDATLAQSILQFNGTSFFNNNQPFSTAYTENGAGQYFVSPNSEKRASFADSAVEPRHQMLYSRHHKSKYFCGSCHDVSNPVLANLGADPTQPLPTEQSSASSYFHVERTFSEFMLSAYGRQGGADTNPEFQAQGAPAITHAAKCQDCHMRDEVGVGSNLWNSVVRPSGSVEHPQSGIPLHDFTGGNVWVSWVLASATPGSANYDFFNAQQLYQGSAHLTLDLSQGEGIDPVALLAGVKRARQQLLLAATIKNLSYNAATGLFSFQVQNNSGHKLISGFPEGRRMFVNIKVYLGGSLIYEVNPYDPAAGTLKGLSYSYQGLDLPDPQPLDIHEAYVDELVYEMHPSSSLTGESETFHFALADGRYKDNRIPPRGFRIAEADTRLSVPVWHGAEDENYFSPAEYAGGYDEVSLTIPAGADTVRVNLYYQTTSREYIEFLRDEINGTASTLTGIGAGGDPPYIVQTDPFFSKLAKWGDTIWNLWTHNMNIDGAAPLLMSQAAFTTAIMNVTSPNGGEVFASGGTYDVTWETLGTTNSIDYVEMYFSKNKGRTWKLLGTESGNPGVSSCVFPIARKNENDCLVKVMAYDAADKNVADDQSDAPFTIEVVTLNSPNAGETLTSGTTRDINWDTYETKKEIAKVVLKFTTNGGRTWAKITTIKGENPGTYLWTVPVVAKAKNKCKVKVRLKDINGKSLGVGKSGGYFSIQP